MILLVLFLLFRFTLASDRKDTPFHRHLNVLFVYSGQLRFDGVLLVILGDIYRRRPFGQAKLLFPTVREQHSPAEEGSQAALHLFELADWIPRRRNPERIPLSRVFILTFFR